MKNILFKPSYYFSRKLLLLFILILSGLNSYSQTYKISDYNGQTVNTCSGTFYDSGVNPGGFYADNENYTVTFCSNNGNALKFAFSLFKLEVKDTLIVYDGPNTSSPVFRKYTGESLPPFSINSTGTCFTFVFKSNDKFFREGWVAAISCCPPPVISAIVPSVSRLCAGSTVNYSVDNHAGSTYNWTVINGTPSSITGGLNNLDVTWDLNGDITGLVKVVEVNSCGSKDSTELIVDIDKLPPVNFTGLAAYYCVYSPSATLTGFPAGGTFSGPGITGNTFNPALAGAGTHNITYFYTDPSTSCSNQITIQTTVDVPSVFIVGASATSYCAGSGVNISLSDSEAGVNYQLKLNGADDGPLMAGTGSPLTWTNKTQGIYTVVAISTLSLCNNNMSGSQTITENPLPIPSFISQPGAATCSADNVTYVTQPGQSNYVWGFTGVSGTDYIISSGGGAANNDVTLRWLTAGSKSVTVNYSDSNGCTATSPVSSAATIVSINPGPPTGSPLQSFCTETSPEVSDLVAAGSLINWYSAASGGSLLPGSTPLTNGTHYFATQTINGCESTTRLDVTATVSSIPSAPVANPGSGAGCSQITANWSASALATSYRLDLSTVNTFATYVTGYQDLNVGNVTTLNITGLTAGVTYYYRIRAVNYCGTSPNSNIITYATLPATPAVPGPITGIATQCAALPGQVYSVLSVPNATTYTWSVPSGWTITSGQGTISVTVTTGAAGQNGNISVTAGNSCGTSAAGVLGVTVNPNASITSVTGASPLCIGATSVYTANGVVLSGGTGAWSSSNPAVATVSPAGLVTGITAGTSNIIYTITGGCGGVVSAQQSVTINPNSAITSVTGASPLCIGATSTYTANGVVLSGGTGAWSSSNPAVATVSPAGLVTGITAGTCNIIYTITGGCSGPVSAQQSITITPNASIVSVTGTSPLCIGATSTYTANGVVLSGGTGAWSSSNPAVATVSATGLVTGITAGNCNIIYTITGGCGGVVSAQKAITIGPNSSIVSVTGASPLCIGASVVYTANGVVLSGGTGAWSSSNPAIASVNSSGLVTSLSPGTCNIIYTITGGCGGPVTSQASVTVSPNAGIVSMTSTSPLCIGGTAVFTANGVVLSGGTGAWSSSNPAVATVDPTGLVTGVTAGTANIIYTITGGCGGVVSAQQPVTINPNAAVTSVSGLSPLCIGATTPFTANGTVLSGGTGAWSSSNPAVASVNASGTVTGISAGNSNIIYTITGGCGGVVTASGNITVTDVPAATISYTGTPWCSNEGIKNVVVSGTPGGSFTSAPAGLSIDPVTGSIDPGTSLAGTYTVTYTISAVGCSVVTTSASVTINQVPTVIVNDPVAVCDPATVDLTSVAVTAGSTPGLTFTYWTDASATIPLGTPNSVGSGNYYIKGTDASGCYDIRPVTAIVNPVPTVTGVQSDVLCSGASTGAIDIAVSGGTGPYSYAWSGTGVIVSSEDQSGLTAGLYSVIATDANLCSSVLYQVTLTEPTALSGTITAQTNVTVFGGNDGSVTVDGSGGISPYQYSIASGPFQASGTFDMLSAGSYTVTVQDVNLCTYDVSVTITQPLPPLSGSITSQTDVACFGASTGSVTVQGAGGLVPYEYSLNGGAYQLSGTFGTLASGPYTVTIMDANLNTFDVAVLINQPASAVNGSISSQTNVLCFGSNTGSVTVAGSGGVAPYNYKLGTGSYQASGTFGSMVAGNYLVTIQDANLCTFDIPVVINQPASALTGSIFTQVNVLCSGASNGSVTVTAAGGTAPYEYRLNGGTPQSSGSFVNLAAGTYTVTAVDANMCTVNVTVIITQPQALAISYAKEDASCPGEPDGSVTLSVSGGTAPYSVIWSDGVITQNRTDIPDGTYSVVVTDFNGCASSLDVIVGFIGTGSCLEVMNIITPNGDGYNDTWKIKNIDLFPDAEVFVYNRWGKLVFKTKNISANDWDGTSDGKELPTDSYHYILDLHDGSETKSGVISIIR